MHSGGQILDTATMQALKGQGFSFLACNAAAVFTESGAFLHQVAHQPLGQTLPIVNRRAIVRGTSLGGLSEVSTLRSFVE